MSFITQASGDVVDVWCFQTELEHTGQVLQKGDAGDVGVDSVTIADTGGPGPRSGRLTCELSVYQNKNHIHSFLHHLSIPTGTPNALPRLGLSPTPAEHGQQPNPLSRGPQTPRGLSEFRWEKGTSGCPRILIPSTRGAWGSTGTATGPAGVVPDRVFPAEAKGAAQPNTPVPLRQPQGAGAGAG